MTRTPGAQVYVDDLEEHLCLALFHGSTPAASEAAVLLVRVALAGGDRARAAQLAQATQRLTADKPLDPDMEAAALHVRGLVERDSVILERAALGYHAPQARAEATEDAGQAAAARGEDGTAVARWQEAYRQYEQLGCGAGMARVRSRLRTRGVRLHHWKRADRPSFGWASLTETERRIAELVAHGFSNREVAEQVFLSVHTVAFHLRHIFWKLDVSSRVQLAGLVAAQREGNAAAGVPG